MLAKLLHTIWGIITSPFRFILWTLRTVYNWLANIVQKLHLFFTEEPQDESLPDTFAKTVEDPMGVLYHLNELRKHLFRAAIFIALTTAFSFFYTRRIIDLLAKPIGGIDQLQAIDVTEPIGVFMRVALLSGFALALPYIAFELWLFAAPGLTRKARFKSLAAIPAIAIFFLGGMLFAYYVMLPTALPFLLGFLEMETAPRPSSFIGFVTGLLFWIGIAFEFPLVIYLIAALGFIKAKLLVEQWRLAIVIIAIISAAITPTIDPINMALVMGPMVILFFLSIALAFLAQRGR